MDDSRGKEREKLYGFLLSMLNRRLESKIEAKYWVTGMIKCSERKNMAENPDI